MGYASQRASNRVHVLCSVRFKKPSEKLAKVGTTMAVNTAGLYVISATIPKEGDELELSLAFPGRRGAFRARALVVFPCPDPKAVRVAHPPGFGAKFLDASEELLAVIRRLTPG